MTDVIIIGMGKSGISSSRLCVRQGLNVTLYDSKKREAFGEEVLSLEKLGVKLVFGAFDESWIDENDTMVLSPGVPTDLPFIAKAMASDNIVVIGEIELAYMYGKGQIIGITGTNGKTTTTTLVGEIIKSHHENTHVVGNIGMPYTDVADTLEEEAIVVAELSSYQLETIDQFRPYVSCCINLTEDHLQRHKTMENYGRTKARMAMNQEESDYIVVNALDSYCVLMAEETKARAVWFSTDPTGDIYVKDGVIYSVLSGDTQEIMSVSEIPIIGEHNVENVVAAVAMCLVMKIPVETIVAGIKAFRGVAHRIEFVEEVNGVRYYNDSKATNPDAAIQGVKSMDRPTVLIAGGMDKGSDYGPWIDFFGDTIKCIVLYGETKQAIKSACVSKGYSCTHLVDTLEEAVQKAADLSESGDNVLLSPACASWDMFKNFEVRGDLFKSCVNKLVD